MKDLERTSGAEARGATRPQGDRENKRYKALFVTAGSFSHTNGQLLPALRAQCPNVDFEEFNVAEHLHNNTLAMLQCGLGACREYGLLTTLSSKARLRYRLFRAQSYFERAGQEVRDRYGDAGFDFTIQTQSMFSAALPGVPNYVYTDHVALARLLNEDHDGTGVPSDVWLGCERRIYQAADHVFTFGPKIQELLIHDYGTAPDKVSAIGAGASARPTRPVDLDISRYVRRNILFVGIDWERKGGPELVEAFKLLREDLPDATLTIVGCSPDLDVEGCEVLGRMPLDQVAPHFHHASCFCMPSRVEPFGIVFTEAMQFGLPVVSTTVGDIGAIVQDGVTGRLSIPRDVPGLAQALLDVLQDPETCQAMGRAGLDRGRQFTWNAVARRLAAQAPGAEGRPVAHAVEW